MGLDDRGLGEARALGRREALKLTGAGLLGALLPVPLRWSVARPGRPDGAPAGAPVAGPLREGPPFTPVAPTAADELKLAPELSWQLVAVEGDPLQHDAEGHVTALVGAGCDHLAFVPIDLRERACDLAAPQLGFVPRDASAREGLLVVNHEGITLRLFHADWKPGQEKSERHLRRERHAVGVAVLHVRRGGDGAWEVVEDSPFARRLDADTPHLLTGPAAALDGGPEARGTLANCSGGMTPWGSVLSCEENFHEFASPALHYRWPKEPYGTKRHWGWVVEVDPFEPASTPRKHTALGRFRHENIAIRVGGDGTLAAYMGDDKNDACLYKFVADGKVTGDRAQDRALLESGRLYVAQVDDLGDPGVAAKRGRWLLLDRDAQPALREAKGDDGAPRFPTQAEVLAEAADAARVLGGSPLERPEDAEVHPRDGSLYVALTNQKKRDPVDWHGRIVRLEEAGGEPAALEFTWSVFAEGGPQSGFSCPDNLCFTASGDLWVTSDITSEELRDPPYAARGNNGLFYFRTSGPQAGIAFQAGSAPVDAELTGPWFTPDGGTLFLSVQHPGETSKSRDALTSHWPRGGSSVPLSAVVAIRGF